MEAARQAVQGRRLVTPGYLRVQVDGTTALVRDLSRLGLRVSDLDFRSIANQGMRLAAGFAPKRSGVLARSIKANKAKNRATIKAGNARVPYAAPINYGWARRNIDPSNFMQKADAVLRRRVPAELERQINRAIRNRGMS